MSRRTVTTAALLVALAVPTAAAAETSTFGVSERGNLRVVSSVVKTRKAVEMMGGWLNESKSCLAQRRLVVKIEIFRTRGGSSGFHEDRISRRVMNCAEGGPNLGFQLMASDVGFDCANGRWKPGRYDFVTRTKHKRTGTVALATLNVRVHKAC